MYVSNLHGVEVGQVFTPIRWAEWLIERWDIFDAWIDGASIVIRLRDRVLLRSRCSVSPN